jgi:hypothetical protein
VTTQGKDVDGRKEDGDGDKDNKDDSSTNRGAKGMKTKTKAKAKMTSRPKTKSGTTRNEKRGRREGGESTTQHKGEWNAPRAKTLRNRQPNTTPTQDPEISTTQAQNESPSKRERQSSNEQTNS